jgi:hypothetical protein
MLTPGTDRGRQTDRQRQRQQTHREYKSGIPAWCPKDKIVVFVPNKNTFKNKKLPF